MSDQRVSLESVTDWFWQWWPIHRGGVYVGRTRLQWWRERSAVGEWWTIHVTLHRYGMAAKGSAARE